MKLSNINMGKQSTANGPARIAAFPYAMLFLLFIATPLTALELNGIAIHSELRRDFYLGALYVTVPTTDSTELVESEQHKRMVLRVVAKRWSTRSFEQHWTQSILINNEQAALSDHSDDILRFTAALKGKLLAGDELVFEHKPGSAMHFQLNGVELFTAENNSAGFFNLLLNSWIGARPSSSAFKRDILQIPGDSDQLLTIFDDMNPAEGRVAEVKSWLKTAAPPPEKPAEQTAKTESNSRPEPKPVASLATKTNPPASAPQAAKPASNAASIPVKVASTANAAASTSSRTDATVAAANDTSNQAKAADRARQQQLEAEEQARKAAEYERQLSGLRLLYRSNIMKLVYSKVVYPGRAIDRNQEGNVEMRLRLKPNGKLIDASITTESDYSLLNKAALQALKEAAPFPAAPKKLPEKEIALDIPIRFQIPR